MADAQDVSLALAGLCASACYPTGTSNPSVTGAAVRCYVGYPVAEQLDMDLQAGVCHVGVDIGRGATKSVPSSLSGPEVTSFAVPTTSWSSVGSDLSLWGSVTAGQIVTAIVDGVSFSYTQTSADTLGSTAYQLAKLIAASYPSAYSLGSVLFVPRAGAITANITRSPTTTTTWASAGNTLTLGGAVTAGQVVTLLVDDLVFAYAQSSADTLATTAAALAALAAAVYYPTASASGATITAPGCHKIAARVSASGSYVQPVHRQMQEFVVTIYAAGAVNRQTIGAAIDVGIAETLRITMPDGTIGNVRFTWVSPNDRPERALLFIRKRAVQVEYDTVSIGTATQIGAFTGVMLSGPNAQQGEGILSQGGDNLPITEVLISTDGNYLASDDAGSIVGTP